MKVANQLFKDALAEGNTVRQAIAIVKQTYGTNMANYGIPIKHLPNQGIITVTFANKTYMLSPVVIQQMNIYEHPIKDKRYNSDVPIMKLANLAVMQISIPCISGDEFALYRASHRAAVVLYEKYAEFCFRYGQVWEDIMQFILDYEFVIDETEHGPVINEESESMFSMALYGNPTFRDVERIKIVHN